MRQLKLITTILFTIAFVCVGISVLLFSNTGEKVNAIPTGIMITVGGLKFFFDVVVDLSEE